MAIYIFTTSIMGGSGLDKSVVQTANLLYSNEKDINIITFTKQHNSNKFTKGNNFKLNENIKIRSLHYFNFGFDKEIEKENNIKYKVRHKFYRANFSELDILKIQYIVKEFKEDDYIIFSTPIISRLFSIGNIKTKAKKIVQIHSDYEEDISNREELINSLDVIDQIQTVAQDVIPYIKKITNFKDEQIYCIYNILKTKEEDQNQVIELKNIGETKTISVIGSLQERKNQKDALKVINELKDQDIKLLIWGNPKGEYKDEMDEYIKENKLEHQVEYMGFAKEEEIYSQTDIVIATALSEGFNYTLLEGLYWSKPLVSYNFLYGPSEMIIQGENGYLINLHDYKTMAQKIKKIINNKDLYKKMQLKSKEIFDNKFSYDKITQMYLNVLKDGNRKSDLNLKENEYRAINNLPEVNRITKKYYLFKDISFEYKLNDEKNIISKSSKLKELNLNNNNIKQLDYNLENGVITFSTRLWYKRARKIIYFLEDENNNQYSLFKITQKNNLETNFFEKNSFYTTSEIIFQDKGVLIPTINEQVKSLKSNGKDLTFSYEKVDYNNQTTLPGIRVNEMVQQIDVYFKNKHQTFTNLNNVDFSYLNIIKDLEKLEKKHNLWEFKIDNIYVWELIRPNLEILLAKKRGIFIEDIDVNDNNIVNNNKYNTEFPKHSKSNKAIVGLSNNDGKNKSFINENTDYFSFEPNGYDYLKQKGIKGKNNTLLIMPFIKPRKLRVKEMEKVEQLNTIIYEILKQNYVRNILYRINKFKKEYIVWTNMLKKNNYDEIIIASSIWVPGIVKAAKDQKILTSELQYALITPNHLNYGLSYKKRHYYTDKMYIWDEFWKQENDFSPVIEVYDTKKAYNNLQQNVSKDIDVVIIGQHLIGKNIIKYIKDNINTSNKKIVYCAHPKEHYEESERPSNIKVVYGDTLNYVKKAKEVWGVFSTVLYDAHFIGKEVKILKVPSYEIVVDKKSKEIFEYI